MGYKSQVTNTITTAIKITPNMSNTDRLGGVFPRDVVVEVRVVCCAANLEFLPNNAHIFIRLQDNIWRVTKLWSKRNYEKVSNLVNVSLLINLWQLWVTIPTNQVASL